MSTYYEVEFEATCRAATGVFADSEEEAREIAESEGCELTDISEIIGSEIRDVKEGGF